MRACCAAGFGDFPFNWFFWYCVALPAGFVPRVATLFAAVLLLLITAEFLIKPIWSILI